MERRSRFDGKSFGHTRLGLDVRGEHEPPVLVLTGEFDAGTVPEIDRFLRRRLGPFYDREHLVIDLSGITFVDSSFVGYVVRLVKQLRCRGKELLLVRPAGQVRRLLAICGLPNVVPVFESLEDALGSLRTGPLPLIPPRFDFRRNAGIGV
jgi:anti-sigma B factor antagonist